jgi:tRNA pseudouridine38-40 synthase
MKRNIRLILAYDGSKYHGFQRQNNGITIQEVLEECIGKITGERINIIGSGRTDAGVHAKGQVVNFVTESRIPIKRFPYAINSVLPKDIAVMEAGEEALEFHARFDAKGKTYQYILHNDLLPDVFMRKYAWHVREKLEFAKLQDGAKYFIGKHDFAAFCAAGSSVKTTVRTIRELTVTPCGDKIVITVTADGFLYNMVRIIVGTLVEVGKGKIPVEELETILAQRNRKLAGPTAPPHGLYLMRVYYDH